MNPFCIDIVIDRILDLGKGEWGILNKQWYRICVKGEYHWRWRYEVKEKDLTRIGIVEWALEERDWHMAMYALRELDYCIEFGHRRRMMALLAVLYYGGNGINKKWVREFMEYRDLEEDAYKKYSCGPEWASRFYLLPKVCLDGIKKVPYMLDEIGVDIAGRNDLCYQVRNGNAKKFEKEWAKIATSIDYKDIEELNAILFNVILGGNWDIFVECSETIMIMSNMPYLYEKALLYMVIAFGNKNFIERFFDGYDHMYGVIAVWIGIARIKITKDSIERCIWLCGNKKLIELFKKRGYIEKENEKCSAYNALYGDVNEYMNENGFMGLESKQEFFHDMVAHAINRKDARMLDEYKKKICKNYGYHKKHMNYKYLSFMYESMYGGSWIMMKKGGENIRECFGSREKIRENIYAKTKVNGQNHICNFTGYEDPEMMAFYKYIMFMSFVEDLPEEVEEMIKEFKSKGTNMAYTSWIDNKVKYENDNVF
jgi:hypothetical protein